MRVYGGGGGGGWGASRPRVYGVVTGVRCTMYLNLEPPRSVRESQVPRSIYRDATAQQEAPQNGSRRRLPSNQRAPGCCISPDGAARLPPGPVPARAGRRLPAGTGRPAGAWTGAGAGWRRLCLPPAACPPSEQPVHDTRPDHTPQCATYTKLDSITRSGEVVSTLAVPDAFQVASLSVGPISLLHSRVGALKVRACVEWAGPHAACTAARPTCRCCESCTRTHLASCAPGPAPARARADLHQRVQHRRQPSHRRPQGHQVWRQGSRPPQRHLLRRRGPGRRQLRPRRRLPGRRAARPLHRRRRRGGRVGRLPGGLEPARGGPGGGLGQVR
jgi:hypothetical protein